MKRHMEWPVKGEKKKKREKMPPAAPDSSAEELSGIFIKKRHASQDVELHPLHDSLASTRTHTHSAVKRPVSLHTLQALCACTDAFV